MTGEDPNTARKERPSKDAVAAELAQAHFDVDPGVKQIIRLLAPEEREADEREPIKLLEVNRDTPPVGITPVYFGTHAASGMVYPSIIVEIAPEEYTQTTLQELERRYGWRVGPPLNRRARRARRILRVRRLAA